MTAPSFTPSSAFLELVATSSLNYRECALLGLMALISHEPTSNNNNVLLDEYIATALHYGATESEIQNVVFQSSFSVGAARAVVVRARVEAALKSSLRGRLHHLETELLVGEASGAHKTVVRDSDPSNTSVVPIVLIHALGLDRRMWDAVFASLAASRSGTDQNSPPRVISYDLRGHGYAAHAPSAQSLTQLAADLNSLLEALQIPRADVYGQSYGGAVAQYFALEYPQATRSVGLITTAGEAQPSWKTRATRAEESGSVMPLLPETLLRWFTPEAIARNEWGVRYARSCVERISVQDWGDAWQCMSGLDTLGRIQAGGVKCPVLLVCGVQDKSTGPMWMARLKEACEKGGSRLVVYKEVDPGVHMMALEQGEALTKEILEFRRVVDGEGV